MASAGLLADVAGSSLPLSLFGSTASSSQGLEKPAGMGDSSLQTRETGFSLEPGALLPTVPSSVFNGAMFRRFSEERKEPFSCWHRRLSPPWVGPPSAELCWESLALTRFEVRGQT